MVSCLNRLSSNVKASLGIVLGAILMIGVAGCGSGHFGETIPASQINTFRYSMVTNPTTLDPATVQDGDTIDIIQQIFEGLVTWGEDNKIKPCLAESWDIKDKGKTYVFHLRKDVKFSNGQPMTAEDFKFSFDRSCNPAIHSATASDYLGNIVGVQQCLAGRAKGVSGVKVLDPYTLEIDLVKPAYYFLGDLVYPAASAVASKSVPADKQITSVDQMIGTGPFIATKYVEGQVFSMKSNPLYYLGKPKIDGIDRPIVKDAVTRLNMFKENQLDLVQLERQDAEGIMKDPKFKDDLQFFNRPATWYLAFNQDAYAPFANRHVRRAFAMAVDTTAICKNVLDGLNPVATGIIPPGVLGYRKNADKLPYDPAAAKAELAAGGFSDGSKMPPLKLFFRSDREDVKIVAESIQSYLKKNLDVTVSLAPTDWITFLQKNDNNQLPLYHSRWAADYLDPQDFLSMLLASYGPENHQGYSNPQFDKLCEEADPMPSEDPKRLALYAKAEDIALQDAAWLPIYFQRDAELISPRVHGLRESAFGHLPHTTVWLTH